MFMQELGHVGLYAINKILNFTGRDAKISGRQLQCVLKVLDDWVTKKVSFLQCFFNERKLGKL